MSAISLIRLNHLLPTVNVLHELGVPTDRIMQRVTLPTLALGDPEVFSPSHLIYRFLEVAARSEGIDDLGWRASDRVRIEDVDGLGVHFKPASCAPTLGHALDSAFSSLGVEATRESMWAVRRGETVWLCYCGSHGSDSDGTSLVEQYAVGNLIKMVQAATGPGWRPQQVHLKTTSERGLATPPVLSHAHVQLGQDVSAIAVPRRLLSMPLRHDSGRRSLSRLRPEKPSIVVSPPHSFLESLRQSIRPFADSGFPSIQDASNLAGASVRTLQRRLKEEGVTYEQVVDDLRKEHALRRVQDDDVKLLDVATELGYSDAAHLTRAFRRWTGMSPSEYRRTEASPVRASA